MANQGSVIVSAGQVSITVVGGSAIALNLATVLAATGGAMAIGLVGFGLYRLMINQNSLRQVLAAAENSTMSRIEK